MVFEDVRLLLSHLLVLLKNLNRISRKSKHFLKLVIPMIAIARSEKLNLAPRSASAAPNRNILRFRSRFVVFESWSGGISHSEVWP